MRNVIEGFSQELLMAHDLDLTDAVLLKHLVDFSSRGDGWNRGGLLRIIEDLPILKLSRKDLWERLEGLAAKGFLILEVGENRVCSIKVEGSVTELMYAPRSASRVDELDVEERYKELYIGYFKAWKDEDLKPRFGPKEVSMLRVDLAANSKGRLKEAMLAFFDPQALRNRSLDDFAGKSKSYSMFSSVFERLAVGSRRQDCPKCHGIGAHAKGCQNIPEKTPEPDEELDDGTGYAEFIQNMGKILAK